MMRHQYSRKRHMMLWLYFWVGGIPMRRAWRSARMLLVPSPAPPMPPEMATPVVPRPHLTMGDWDVPERSPWE